MGGHGCLRGRCQRERHADDRLVSAVGLVLRKIRRQRLIADFVGHAGERHRPEILADVHHVGNTHTHKRDLVAVMEHKAAVSADRRVIQHVCVRSCPGEQNAVDKDHHFGSGIDRPRCALPDPCVSVAFRQDIADRRPGANRKLFGARYNAQARRFCGGQLIGQRDVNGDGFCLRNQLEIRCAERRKRTGLRRHFIHAHGAGEGAVLLRGVQCLAALCYIVLPAFRRVVGLVQRVIIARVERDTGQRVFAGRLKHAVDTCLQAGLGFFQRLNQRVHIRLRMFDGAVFLCCCDVPFRVLREQGIEQRLRCFARLRELRPAADRVILFIFVRVLIQRLIKSCRVDLRRWDQVCDSFG